LTLPAVGKGPFPGVLLIQGSGAVRPSPEIAPYLSERGFAVLQYDKRGVTKVKNIVLMGTVAQDYRDIIYYCMYE
jgi:predicted alpha/beta hydrolase